MDQHKIAKERRKREREKKREKERTEKCD